MQRYTNDLLASVVVFLVALPLCMGISIASGVPPALGLITGIIGGIVVGTLAGAPLQVSGPAAGLTVLIWDLVQKHGIEALGPVVLIGGALQFAAGLMGIGRWFRAMSPAVIYGMLAGIGVLIFASQFHVMLDDRPKSSGIQNLLSIPEAILNGIFPIDGSSHELAAVVGILTIVVLLLWDKYKRGKLALVPGPLMGVVAAMTVAGAFGLQVKYVDVPSNLLDVANFPGAGWAGKLIDPVLLMEAVALAFIASAETLLCAAALDRMQTISRTDYDKELRAQGAGNLLCGLFGALPLTGVIVRSSANIQAGAQTRTAAILHGVWLLAFVALFPAVLRLIPTSSLGAILVYTGYKLVNVRNIRQLTAYGRFPVLIYAATLITIVCTDLLTGVLTGIALSFVRLLYQVTHLEIRTSRTGHLNIELAGAATFIMMPKLAAALESAAPGEHVHLRFGRLAYIDHSCLDMIANWRAQHEQTGGSLMVEWNDLRERDTSMAKSPALQTEPLSP